MSSGIFQPGEPNNHSLTLTFVSGNHDDDYDDNNNKNDDELFEVENETIINEMSTPRVYEKSDHQSNVLRILQNNIWQFTVSFLLVAVIVLVSIFCYARKNIPEDREAGNEYGAEHTDDVFT